MAKKKTYGKTARGVPITDELVAELAKKAEAGYDVDEMLRRRGGRPPIGSAAATVESVRLDPELREALAQSARRNHETTSSTIRKALRKYLDLAAEPRATVDVGSVELVGQQLAFYRALAEHSGELAGRYLGASAALMVPANPERLAQAAHSIRELMNNLHTISNVPVKAKGGRLSDAFAAMTEKWEKAKWNSECFGDEGWRGEIDDAARRGFEAVDEAITWQKENRPKWKEQHRSTLRGLDASRRPLPTFIEDRFIELWDEMRDYFVDVCHHRRETTEEEFRGTLDQLERFVLDRLKPRTFPEQATLDALIAETERGS